MNKFFISMQNESIEKNQDFRFLNLNEATKAQCPIDLIICLKGKRYLYLTNKKTKKDISLKKYIPNNVLEGLKKE